MKYVPHAAAISLVATQSVAGGLSNSIMEAPAVVEAPMEEPSGSADWVLPLLLLGLFVGLASTDDDDNTPRPPQPPAPPPSFITR